MIAMSSVVGSLPTWIIVALALFAAWRLSKGGAGSAVSELAKSNDVLEEALREERAHHQETKDKMGAEIRDLKVEVAHLRGKTDLSLALAEWGDALDGRAERRHTAQLKVLNLIAQRLGPEREAA